MLVTCVRIFYTTLFTNNIKIMIKSSTFLIHPYEPTRSPKIVEDDIGSLILYR